MLQKIPISFFPLFVPEYLQHPLILLFILDVRVSIFGNVSQYFLLLIINIFQYFTLSFDLFFYLLMDNVTWSWTYNHVSLVLIIYLLKWLPLTFVFSNLSESNCQDVQLTKVHKLRLEPSLESFISTRYGWQTQAWCKLSKSQIQLPRTSPSKDPHPKTKASLGSYSNWRKEFYIPVALVKYPTSITFLSTSLNI